MSANNASSTSNANLKSGSGTMPASIANTNTPAATSATASSSKAGNIGDKKDSSKAQAAAKKKVRRKKPPSAKGPSSQAIVAAAKQASGELSAFKAAEAAKRKDPLWYRANEVLQSISGDNSPVPGLLAEQVDLVEAALNRNHLTRADITPQAFAVLLEQARRYALEVVADAQDCAYAAHRNDITRADILMALELRPDHANTHTLGELQKMTLVAHNLNRIPIPPIPQHCYSGVVLPPKPHQLTSRTFDIITGAHTAMKMNQPLPSPKTNQTGVSSNANNSTTTSTQQPPFKKAAPTYGASRGRQIPISLQSTSYTPQSTQQSSSSTMRPPSTMSSLPPTVPPNTGTAVPAAPTTGSNSIR